MRLSLLVRFKKRISDGADATVVARDAIGQAKPEGHFLEVGRVLPSSLADPG
jgi:hypothetical protein